LASGSAPTGDVYSVSGPLQNSPFNQNE
jgi:hypothetical protein